ncbi:MAG: hypothetical protein FGM37_03405 [Phycisphaerales bacterium]|nr:hypothetical protein [Phycisphaerales bacterium]
MLPIGFERPIALLLLLALPALWWGAWRWRHATGVARAWTAATVRSVLLLLLAGALAQPSIVRRGEGVTLLVVADVSRSVPPALLQRAESALQQAVAEPPNREDRVGVVTVAREAAVAEIPRIGGEVHLGGHGGDAEGSDLAAGLRRALALLPADTMNRILLVSDGNETAGSLSEAADLAAANGIPIDVLPLEYAHPREVVMEALRVPARARLGQAATMRVLLRSQGACEGTLYIWRNDQPIDLDADTPGAGRRISLSAGPNTIEIPIALELAGAQRFRAVFEPDPACGDAIVENNAGAATAFVEGDGRVLVVDDTGVESASLVDALRAGRIGVDVIASDALAGGIAVLSGYDAVVLSNIPRYAVDNATDRMLKAYVHDLGGGLLMTGGDRSFGAGGWIDSETAKAIPVKMDPPATRELPRGALALVVHSCEMPQGNYWGQQVAIAAIEALSRLDYIGIVVFGFGGGGNGAQWAHPMQLAGDKTAAVAAARGMVVGDMQDWQGALTLAYEGLMGVRAGQRHVIMISDGDPAPPTQALLDSFKSSRITITTVMVYGHGSAADFQNMRAMAEQTGGTFYNITAATVKSLPRIFTKEATMVSRTLVLEGDFQPEARADVGGPVSVSNPLPRIGGYIVTVPREGLAQVPVVNVTSEGTDPIFAYWNHGLGKAIAYTSDTSGRWGSNWIAWPGYQPFWERAVRWLMRPPAPSNIAMRTRTEGEQAIVELDATDAAGGLANFLRTDARIVRPDGTVAPLPMEQTGPGRYQARFDTPETGSYLVDVGLLDGRGARSGGSVQASVSVPYAREFRSTRDNAALLRSVAERTGGTAYTIADVATAQLFDRRGLAVPEAVRRIWDVLAIVAAALLVMDVAVRRLAFDRDAAKELAQGVVGSTSAATGQSVAAWRAARSRAAVTRDAAGESAPPAAGGSGLRKGAGPAARGASSPAPTGPESAQAPSPPPVTQPDADADSPLSRLRKAKRRAQEEREGGDGSQGHG